MWSKNETLSVIQPLFATQKKKKLICEKSSTTRFISAGAMRKRAWLMPFVLKRRLLFSVTYQIIKGNINATIFFVANYVVLAFLFREST